MMRKVWGAISIFAAMPGGFAQAQEVGGRSGVFTMAVPAPEPEPELRTPQSRPRRALYARTRRRLTMSRRRGVAPPGGSRHRAAADMEAVARPEPSPVSITVGGRSRE